MNKITEAFKNKKAFIAFITGGDPDIETTTNLILAMQNAGVDIIEIGIPFSDPVAEGLIIQGANERALAAGCTTDKLFEMVKSIQDKIKIPLLFMTYLNPIYVYGKEKFAKNCQECGIQGIIVPDMPFEEKSELADICDDYNLSLVSLIAPTSGDRGVMIAKEAQGFLYCVSSLGVTGTRDEISLEMDSMIKDIKKVNDIPCAIGFGIKTPEQAKALSSISDGIIIGSAIVEIVGKYGKDSIEPVKDFVKEIKKTL